MLIETLKQHHKDLAQLIRQLDANLESGEEEGVRIVLSSLSQVLRVHLTLEDQQIYPGLIRAAEVSGDERRLETARLFSNNMQRISESLKAFLSRHEASFHLERFRSGWGTLCAVLTKRIEAAERALYPLYEQRVLGQSALPRERSLTLRCYGESQGLAVTPAW